MSNNYLELHPSTLKHLLNGHPWITADEYSRRFPVKSKFLTLINPKDNKRIGQFIHDPHHPKVKARLWIKGQAESNSFENILFERLKRSAARREEFLVARDCYYLSFGEVDQLPGLFIIVFGKIIIIQSQSLFWNDYKAILVKHLKQIKSDTQAILFQLRAVGSQKTPPQLIDGQLPEQQVTEEFGLNYILKPTEFYDPGFYPDMSGVRERLKGYLPSNGKALNLFSYTGAFTLQALEQGLEVSSVDLSSKYMSWLEDNIKINQLPIDKHTSLVKRADKVIDAFAQSNKKFDWIVCDPPSFFSDKKKSISSIQFYQKFLQGLLSLLEKQGSLVIFLNTHNYRSNRFNDLVDQVCQKHKELSKVAKLTLTADCPTEKFFPEGNYLKGFVLKRLS
jgi:23S rRNA (cytosine1962-C5)-methyltransferase